MKSTDFLPHCLPTYWKENRVTLTAEFKKIFGSGQGNTSV